jgi:hypothetical protein
VKRAEFVEDLFGGNGSAWIGLHRGGDRHDFLP